MPKRKIRRNVADSYTKKLIRSRSWEQYQELKQDPFRRLPDDMMILIFEHIPLVDRIRIEIVCRRWRLIARKKCWINVRQIFIDSTVTKYNALELLTALVYRCGQYLLELHLKAFHSRMKFSSLLQLMPNLQHFHFNGSRATASIVDEIKLHLYKLKSLTLEQYDYTNPIESYFSSEAAKSLQILRINTNVLIDPPNTLPKQLKLLNISSRDEYWLAVSDQTYRIEQISKTAAKYCPDLCFLMLPVHNSISFETFDQIMLFKRLKYLRIKFLPSATVKFVQLLSGLPDLQVLIMDQIDYQMIHAVVEMCPSLIHFSFTCDPTRNDLNAIKQLSQLPDLYSLSIGLTRKLRSTNMPVMLSSLSAVIEKGALKYFHCGNDCPLDFDFISTMIRTCRSIELVSCQFTPAVFLRMNELHTVVEDVFAEKQKPGTRPTTLQLHTYLTQNKFAQLPLHPWVEYRRIIWREDIHANLLRALCYRWIGTAPRFGNIDD